MADAHIHYQNLIYLGAAAILRKPTLATPLGDGDYDDAVHAAVKLFKHVEKKMYEDAKSWGKE